MITLEIAGIKYEGFTDISIFRSVENISGSFTFSATTNATSLFPIKAGAACAVYIDNNQVIEGYVDSVDVSYDFQNHSITISGRDRTADLVDGVITEIKGFKNMSLIQIINKVLSDHGLSDISVINEAGASLEKFPEVDPSEAPISQTLFDFIESYARKRQVLLTTDGLGNIILARSASTAISTALENKVNGQFNNIKSATARYDLSNRFNKYILQSSQNAAGLSFGADVELDNVATQSGEAIDSSIRASRKSEVISQTSDSNANLTQLAVWTKNLAIARSLEYECVVQGYYADANNTVLWKPNVTVKVADDFANVNATMLVKSVEYSLSVQDGSTTTLTLVKPNSYTLQTSIDEATAPTAKVGDDLLF